MNTGRLKSLLSRPWLLLDRILQYFLWQIRKNKVLSTDTYGWLHAIIYSNGIDLWHRYADITNQIKLLQNPPLNILDVGGSSKTVKEFLDPAQYDIVVADINIEALKRAGDFRVAAIAADGTRLPFKDNSFDVAISVDSLEHVPQQKRPYFCYELKRVARSFVVVHCPADSTDGAFQGTLYDTRFLEWYRNRFKMDEPNTLEHLNCRLPDISDLVQLFPKATLSGRQNAEVWLQYITKQYTPYVRFIAGINYKLRLQNKDNMPPYHACLLVWRKQ